MSRTPSAKTLTTPSETSLLQMAKESPPVAILAVMMFLVPAAGVPSELILQDTLKSALVSLATLLAVGAWLWSQRNRGGRMLWHGMLLLPLILFVYAADSMIWSHTYLAGVEAVRWLVLSLLMWVTLNSVTARNAPLLVVGLHAGLLGASVWAMLQFWADLRFFPQFAAPASTFANRNFFAEFAVCAYPFSVLWLLQLRRSRWLCACGASLGVPVVALLMTGTRSALIAFALLIPVLCIVVWRSHNQLQARFWGKKVAWRVGGAGVSVVLFLGAIPTANQTIVNEGFGLTALQRGVLRASSVVKATEYSEGSSSIRAAMWKATLRMTLAHPLRGIGAGAWENNAPLYQGAANSLETDFYAHNELLQLLSEYGLVVGGGFLAVLLAYLLLCALKTWRLLDADPPEIPLRAVALTSLAALLLVSNAGFPWRLATTGALLALSLGLLAGSDFRLELKEAWAAVSLRMPPLIVAAGLSATVVGLAIAVAISWQGARAEWYLVSAIHQLNAPSPLPPERLEAAKRYLEKGIAINPHYRKLIPIVADGLVTHDALDDALRALRALAESRPNVANIWNNIFLICYHNQDWSCAETALAQAMRLQPDASRTQSMRTVLEARKQ